MEQRESAISCTADFLSWVLAVDGCGIVKIQAFTLQTIGRMFSFFYYCETACAKVRETELSNEPIAFLKNSSILKQILSPNKPITCHWYMGYVWKCRTILDAGTAVPKMSKVKINLDCQSSSTAMNYSHFLSFSSCTYCSSARSLEQKDCGWLTP